MGQLVDTVCWVLCPVQHRRYRAWRMFNNTFMYEKMQVLVMPLWQRGSTHVATQNTKVSVIVMNLRAGWSTEFGGLRVEAAACLEIISPKTRTDSNTASVILFPQCKGKLDLFLYSFWVFVHCELKSDDTFNIMVKCKWLIKPNT